MARVVRNVNEEVGQVLGEDASTFLVLTFGHGKRRVYWNKGCCTELSEREAAMAVELFDRQFKPEQVFHCADSLSDPKLLVKYWNFEGPERLLTLRYVAIGNAAMMAAYIDSVGSRLWFIQTMHEREAEEYLNSRHEMNCGAGI